MGKDLRVVGWLRFANQAQLTKGLRGFRRHEAPGYFEVRQWQVVELDAWIRLESELPGDFNEVEAPFLEMVRAVLEDPLVAMSHALVERATGSVDIEVPGCDQPLVNVWSVNRKRRSYDHEWREMEPPKDAVKLRGQVVAPIR